MKIRNLFMVSFFTLLCFVAFLLSGCSKNKSKSRDELEVGNDSAYAYVTYGKVLEVYDNSCLVEITEKPHKFEIGDNVVVNYKSIYKHGEDDETLLNNDNDYEVNELPVGSIISFTYQEFRNDINDKNLNTKYITIYDK